MSNTTTTANGTARRGKLGQRVAYACGNLGQSAFYNALSTYFVVYVTAPCSLVSIKASPPS